MRSILLFLLWVLFCQAAAAEPDSYIFFNRERERISEASFLSNPGIRGAQLKYTWRELEPQRDHYAFEAIEDDIAFLQNHQKKLFLQIQDVSFDEATVNVPSYLLDDPAFHGGVARKFERERCDGWVARRWDPAVRRRFLRLLERLAERFDGRIEGVVLAETSIDFGEHMPAGFSADGYRDGLLELMSGAGRSFQHSRVILYANFMPGEWLPWEDQGYLKSIYAHALKTGVGVGGPDLLPHRKGQQNHSYPLIRQRGEVCAGVAVQWGNLDATDPSTGRQVTVAELYDFASRGLKLDYLFWGTQEPYYRRDLLPFLSNRATSCGERGSR